MQFTKESVHQNWMLLHGTSDPQTKSNANKYLTQFKVLLYIIMLYIIILLNDCFRKALN